MRLQVIVWKESPEGTWQPAYVSPPTLHGASVNSVAWAPHELGLVLAAGSSDGTVSVLTAGADGGWSATKLSGAGGEAAHLLGVTSVSWAPPSPPGSLVTPGSGAPLVRRLVTGACDNTAKVWGFDDARGGWALEHTLGGSGAGHADWVRDAAWAPNLGMPKNTIATAGQDGKVFIWTQSEPNGPWSAALLRDFGAPVWRVSWSVFGNVLAVADATNAVSLWKEAVDGAWAQVAADAAGGPP